MKQTLRLGSRTSLNIYSLSLQSEVLGHSTLPQEYNENLKNDGVMIHYGSMPGGELFPVNLGKTLTHEVGHWLGLYHTFTESCSYPNDFVLDTLPQKESTNGCPLRETGCSVSDFNDKDLKLFLEGNDRREKNEASFNFMDYSDDVCMEGFTPGQIRRMKLQWELRVSLSL